jgi:hypothetical protein
MKIIVVALLAIVGLGELRAQTTVSEDTLRVAGECTFLAEVVSARLGQSPRVSDQMALNDVAMMRTTISYMSAKATVPFEKEPAFLAAKERVKMEIISLPSAEADALFVRKYQDCSKWKSRMLQELSQRSSEGKPQQ